MNKKWDFFHEKLPNLVPAKSTIAIANLLRAVLAGCAVHDTKQFHLLVPESHKNERPHCHGAQALNKNRAT